MWVFSSQRQENYNSKVITLGNASFDQIRRVSQENGANIFLPLSFAGTLSKALSYLIQQHLLQKPIIQP